MSFLDYINGHRKGKDANRIERDSMTDPFAYDAIDGFDSVDDDHIARLNTLQSRLRAKNERPRHKQVRLSSLSRIAATVAVLVFALGGYLFVDYHSKPNLQAQQSAGGDNVIISIYVPEPYYKENITNIAKLNAQTVKTSKITISRFEVGKYTDSTISKEELDELNSIDKNGADEIDVLLPQEFEERSSAKQHFIDIPVPQSK
ncbi:hypothetical protein [Dysgonomonas sp. 511]|uniref:hypothetical protein n=1 Tax=Dysgonomonas sp. 511 TaxID=2302930 RepID=UPI0013D6AB1A|nr:hypothetical protein [Dysgonomonas sp. 511]NDV79896.1 hypothetical protein [Dysgonomonas sp. 511]